MASNVVENNEKKNGISLVWFKFVLIVKRANRPKHVLPYTLHTYDIPFNQFVI